MTIFVKTAGIHVHCFQHVPFESPAYISDWLEDRAFTLSYTRFYESNHTIPALQEIDALIIMGGPMSVHDEADYPWLVEEKAFIKLAIQAGKKVLGICLGAQLIACCCGAGVHPAPHKEIGWFPLQATETAGIPEWFSTLLAEAPVVLHWHGEQFEIPAGAINLTATAANNNQAFLLNNQVLGLQFHAEMTSSSIAQIVEHCRQELQPDVYIQSEAVITDIQQPIEKANQLMAAILERLLILQTC